MRSILLFVVLFTVLQTAQSQTSYTWNGSLSTSWTTAANWSPSGVPGALDDVKIVTGSNICVLSTSTAINNITLTSGTLDLNGGTLTVNGTTATFSSGTVQNGTIVVSAANTTTFGVGVVNMNCITNISSAALSIRNAIFNGATTITKTGSTNDNNNGGNTFNSATTITNAGTGYLLLANTGGDKFNNAATFNNTGSNQLYVAYNSSGNIFNGVTTFNNSPVANTAIYVSWYSVGVAFNNNIVVTSTSGSGVQFCGGNTSASAILSSGYTISIGGTGFSSGVLSLRQFTQSGSTPINLSLTGSGDVRFGPSGNFGGPITVSTPNIYATSSVFNNTVSFTKTDGTNSNPSSGGNTFNAALYVNYISTTGTGYWSFGNGAADIYNGDVYANNNSLDRIIFGHSSTNNQFNGNLIVTQTGSSAGTSLTWNTGSTAVMAAGKTISIGGAGFSTGYFFIQGLTQNGNTPMNLSTTGSSSIYLGAGSAYNPSVIGGSFTVNAPDIYVRGATFNSSALITKTGGISNHNNGGLNIFNDTLTINQQSNTGYFMLGYNADDQFNGNIILNSTGSGGISLGWTSGTGKPTLAAGKTISIGAGGYSAGFLQLGGFIQAGTDPVNLNLTGTSSFFVVNPGTPCSFGGPLTVTAPDMYIRGGIFNNATTFTKTGGSSNHNNGAQNIFNDALTINQQSNTGYFMLGYNANDQYNGNIIVTSTGTGGISLGWTNGTGNPVLAAGKNISVGAAGFSAGYLQLGGFTQMGTDPINLNFTGTSSFYVVNPGTPCSFGGPLTVTAPDITIRGGIFNDATTFTKTGGSSNHNNSAQNIFNGPLTINQQSNTGYFMLGYNSNEVFNGDITVTSTGTGGINLGYSSGAGTPTLAVGKTINVGGAGFSDGYLNLYGFTQLGSAPMNLNFTGTNTVLTFARNSVIGGNLNASSPDLYFDGCTFNGTVDATKTGNRAVSCRGGNIFNQHCSITNNGNNYWVLGGSVPDTWNDDVIFSDNGSDRLLPCWSSAGNLFNGNIYLNTSGSAAGIHFCGGNNTATATVAAGKTILAGTSGLNAGYVILKQFTQLGNTPVNLSLSNSATYLQFGPSSAIGGNVTSTSPGLYFNGCTFSGTVNALKTGNTNDASNGNNIFNGNTIITNNGAGYLLFGNGNADQFNSAATFNNTGSSHMYVAYNSSNNIFAGITTFNNTPVGNTFIFVSTYSAGTVFNDNIVVTSTAGQGVQFCSGNATATATLAAGKTITTGGGGFTAGSLLLKQFTQSGATPQNIPLTGTATLIFGPSAAFGGNVTASSPSLYFNGCTFSGIVNAVKTGSSNDASSGSNIFNAATTLTNSGAGYLLFGNGNADQFNSNATFNNTGSNHIYVAYNSSNNIFGGVTTFNNTPTANTGIYISSYSAGTVFNDNITVTSTAGQGVQFCTGNTSATAILVAGKTVTIGGGGFSAGSLLLRQFTQSGSTAQNIALTGTGTLIFGPSAAFGGNLTASSPSLYFNGCTFSGTVNATKTGTVNDASNGGNIFNNTTSLINNGTGYLLMTNSSPDTYNGDISFIKNNTGLVYPNYNQSGNYGKNLTITSATTITLGAGSGTAIFNGTGAQDITVTTGTPTLVFTRLNINNSGSGVTLSNTPINVSVNMVLTSGLLNTTTANILTMLNNSTVAAGTALSTSFVNGPMRYQKSSSGSTILNFPVGNGSDCRPVVLTVSHSNGTLYTYQTQLFNASAAALGYTLPSTVTSASAVHYYTIGRTDAAGTNQPTAALSGNQTIQVFFGANDLVTDGNAITVIKNTYTATTSWIDIGGTGGPAYAGGANLTGSITSTSTPTAFNSFSTFAIGFRVMTILPVTLLDFTAQANNDHVDLLWTTTNETKNSFFTIEKSKDGVQFESVKKINTQAVNGNSQGSLKYTAQDLNPYIGRNYYRLKQTDIDGNYTYSTIVLVSFQNNQAVSVYPNPSTGNIYIKGLNTNTTQTEWYDISGRIVLNQTVSVNNGMVKLNTNLANGVYVLKYTTGNDSWNTQKIIIRK